MDRREDSETDDSIVSQIINSFIKRGDNSNVHKQVTSVDDRVEIVMELEEGLEKNNINVKVKNNLLGVFVNQEDGNQITEKTTIPQQINQDYITANFNNGILTVELPKSEESA
jgi:HSP20 family molecular chaperone IbpA